MRAISRRRRPTTPGEILREEFLIPLGMTQRQLADHLACDVKVVNRIVNGRSSLTAEMALKLGATFRTTAEFWLNAQRAVDLTALGHGPVTYRSPFAKRVNPRAAPSATAPVSPHSNRSAWIGFSVS